MAFKYPELKRDDTVDEYHDVSVPDPYRWLEDPVSDETKKFVDDENAVTRPYIDSYQHKTELTDLLTNVWNYPRSSEPFREGSVYYQFKNSGLQNQNVLMVLRTLDAPPEIFLDPNTLSEDGTTSLSFVKFSEDGCKMAYGLSKSGSDWIEIKIRDVTGGFDYPEVLQKVKFSSVAWTHDHRGFFYSAYLNRKLRADGLETVCCLRQRLYYHHVRSQQSVDVKVAQFDDPELRMNAIVSHCGFYLLVMPVKGCKGNMLYFSRIDPRFRITERLNLTPVVSELVDDFEYITNEGSIFYFRTNKGAPNYKIITMNMMNPHESTWRVLIYEHPKYVLDSAKVICGSFLILCYLADCKHQLSVHNLRTGEKYRDLQVPYATVTSMSGKKDHYEFFYTVASFLLPSRIYKVTFGEPNIQSSIFQENQVTGFDLPDEFEVKQVFYKSKDDTLVPMFIIHKPDVKMDGNRPCMLYGYGGFNVNLTPSFNVSRLIFVKNFDGVYALANIRGGGEYGDRWHNSGRLSNKQNCFDDFISAAKYLIDNKYTCSKKLAIQGGSNGGLLVAACINQAPEVFGGAICQVGVLDMLRYHKFTIGYAWKSDYGCSEQNREEFDVLMKYSPLHNIKPIGEGVQYPATLLLTADHDDRVVPLHSYKFIAELQHHVGKSPQQKNPLMIRIETDAGHGAGKPTIKIINEVVDIYSFLAKSLAYDFVRT